MDLGEAVLQACKKEPAVYMGCGTTPREEAHSIVVANPVDCLRSGSDRGAGEARFHSGCPAGFRMRSPVGCSETAVQETTRWPKHCQ
jgi:hypothetical protein